MSLVELTKKNVRVLAIDGDDHLGGEDFDNVIVEHFVSEFAKQTGIDLSTNAKAKLRLKIHAEMSKKILSEATAV